MKSAIYLENHTRAQISHNLGAVLSPAGRGGAILVRPSVATRALLACAKTCCLLFWTSWSNLLFSKCESPLPTAKRA